MSIIARDNRIFVLETAHTHYVVGIDADGRDRHIYWGAPCDPADYDIPPVVCENPNHPALDEMQQECTVFGSTMYRDSVLKATFADGCREILPVFDRAAVGDDRLALHFRDKHYGLSYTLHYRLFPDSDIIEKYVSVQNTGTEPLVFARLFSGELSFPSPEVYIIQNTNGGWGGEYRPTQTPLSGGTLVFESRRGISGHNQSPSVIAHHHATEQAGEVFFAVLAYSGSFKVSVNRDVYGVTRAVLGMNDHDFSFTLPAGQSFDTPRLYAGHTRGLGEMSRQLNRLALTHLLPPAFRDKPLPVLYNSWEATGFDVSAQQQMRLADIAADLGVELFVMDDGWFGARHNDHAGLGDWQVNRDKFPHGLNELIDHVHRRGMGFGLWIEPEMVNPDSDLYRAHPDWAYHYPTRPASELRNQLVLNLTRPDVQQYVFEAVDALLSEHDIQYIKWDMNRPFSETGAENLDNPQMLYYLHTKAVYDIVDALKAKHPGVMFESCASGGGRSDWGALSHFDQCWPSDNTDAIDRMAIQHDFSLLHPTKVMRAWVTDIAGPNKPCSLEFRFHIAMQGALGLGGNLTRYTPAQRELCRQRIALYKQIREVVQFGDLYRLADANEGEALINEYVSRDKTQAVCFVSSRGTRFFKKRMPIRLAGLVPNRCYRLEFQGTTLEKSGAYWHNVGLSVYIRGAEYNEIILLRQTAL